jgi:hypothetical protein
MDHPAHLVKTAHLDPMEAPAQLATRDHPAQLVHPATTELPETRDHLVQMDPRENRVFAPNIAPRTVVSSSKTAHGDKRSQKALRPVCYTDEKPVFFMSIVAFIFYVLFNGQFQIITQPTALNTAFAYPVISFGAF